MKENELFELKYPIPTPWIKFHPELDIYVSRFGSKTGTLLEQNIRWETWKSARGLDTWGVGDSVFVSFESESRTEFSGFNFEGVGKIDRVEDGYVYGRLIKDGKPFMCMCSDVKFKCGGLSS